MRSSVFILLLALGGCAPEDSAVSPTEEPEAPGDTVPPRPLGEVDIAIADLMPVGDNGVRGTARLVRFEEGVRVELRAEGLLPGLHGVHVHDANRCAEAMTSGHFDPVGAPHGDPEDPRPLHHAGDLGNVRATDDGARMDRVFTDLRLDGPHSVVGRIFVVHERQDDLNTQPDGGDGAPVACGVIEPTE